MAIVKIAFAIEFDAEGATSLESALGIQASDGPFDGNNAPIHTPVEEVVFKTPVCHQIGFDEKRANLLRKALGQGRPRSRQAVRLAAQDKRVQIRKCLAQVK